MPPAVGPTLVVASLEHGTLADADASAHLVPTFAGHVFAVFQSIHPFPKHGVLLDMLQVFMN